MNQVAFDQQIFAQPIPDFFPDRLRDACAGKTIQFKIPRGVRERIQVPEDITISEWAEKYRMVTAIDAYPGRWRADLIPHAKFIMDLICKPSVKEVWLCMVERAGKTNIILNTAMWQVDRGVDSGNVFWLMPTENEAKKALGERIIEALKASPRTARLLSRYADNTTRTIIRFRHGPRLFPAWANSAASVSSFFGRLNIADEIDKFDTKGVGSETDIVTLFRKRGRDRDDSKFLFASSPGQRYIHKGMLACEQIWTRTSKCAHCSEYILMQQDRFVFPTEATVETLKSGEHQVEYVCECGVAWDEADRKWSYLNGGEVAIKGGGIIHPKSIGYHGPAWPFPQIKMQEIGAAILRGKDGDTNAKKALANGYGAIDYEPPKVAKKAEAVLALCDDRPRDLIPTGTAALALQVDTQQTGFYYELAAVAYGDSGTSHLVSKGQLLNFEDLVAFTERSWFEAGTDGQPGKEHRIQSALIDSGGTRKAGTPPKHSRTKEVYEFCKKNPIFIPVKGTGRRDTPVKYTNLDIWPGTNKKIPGGLTLVTLDVHYLKDELARRLALHPDDPGAFVLYSGYTQGQLEQQNNSGILPVSELEDYAKHLCAEYRNELGVWIHDHKEGRNDYADCATYRMFHIELLKQQGRLRLPTVHIETEKKTSNQPQKRRSGRW